jgi:hypothetical protein
MEKKELAPGIIVYSNVIPDHDNFLKYFEDGVNGDLVNLNWINQTTDNDDREYIKKVNVVEESNDIVKSRFYHSCPIGYKKSMLLIQDDNSSEELFKNFIGNIFYKSFGPAEKDYQEHYGIEIVWHDIYNILRYGEGHFFNNHDDDHPLYNRKISTVYYVNDNYSGGEIIFPKFNVKYKPQKNDFLMFPSSHIYNHSVNMVTDGTRYSVVSFLS